MSKVSPSNTAPTDRTTQAATQYALLSIAGLSSRSRKRLTTFLRLIIWTLAIGAGVFATNYVRFGLSSVYRVCLWVPPNVWQTITVAAASAQFPLGDNIDPLEVGLSGPFHVPPR